MGGLPGLYEAAGEKQPTIVDQREARGEKQARMATEMRRLFGGVDQAAAQAASAPGGMHGEPAQIQAIGLFRPEQRRDKHRYPQVLNDDRATAAIEMSRDRGRRFPQRG